MAIKLDPKRPGYWYVSYGRRDPQTGKVVSLKRTMFKSQAEAKRELPKLIIAVERKMREVRLPTWAEFLPRFYESRRALDFTAATIEDYRAGLDGHTLEPWGKKLLDEITTEDIRKLIKEGLTGRAQGTRKNVLKFVRSAFRYAVELGLIKENPTPKIAFKIGDKIKKVLTEEQARQLLALAKSCHNAWYPVWAMALYTGMRNGELYALRWDAVDFDRRHICVRESWNPIDGYKSTKSGDDRLVSISPPLLQLLQELKAKAEGEFVLPRSRLWQRGEQAIALREFLKGAGLPEVHFHALRATWATILLGKGVAPAIVMTMGGWKDIKTLMVYVRKAGIDVRGATDCLSLEANVVNKVLNFA